MGAVVRPFESDYQTITLEMAGVEQEIDEPEQIDLEIDKNLDIPIVINDEECAQYHQFLKKHPTAIKFQYVFKQLGKKVMKS